MRKQNNINEENKPIYEVQTEELNHSKSGPLDIAGSFCHN